MRIKVAILDNDKIYLNRLVSSLSSKYSDKMEIYSFSDFDVAKSNIPNKKIDVLLISEEYNIDAIGIPDKCAFAYFVESSDVGLINNYQTVCKFQMVDLIYKHILNLYSEVSGNISSKKAAEGYCNTVVFSSPCGGTGTTTVAVSFAKYCAEKGKRTLYLNLEEYGSSDIYFSGKGQYDMTDIVFAIKSKKTNLGIKLEGCVKQDSSGVFYYSQPKNALDILELSSDEMIEMISKIKSSGNYEYLIVDKKYSIDKGSISVFDQMDSIVMVGDGSENSNTKIFRAIQSLVIKEENGDQKIMGKVSLLYNRFSNKTGKVLENIEVKNIGGIPKYEHASEKQVMLQISSLDIFSKLID